MLVWALHIPTRDCFPTETRLWRKKITTNRSKNKEVYSFLQQKKAEREENLFLPAVAGERSRLPYFVVLFSRHIRVSLATVSLPTEKEGKVGREEKEEGDSLSD